MIFTLWLVGICVAGLFGAMVCYAAVAITRAFAIGDRPKRPTWLQMLITRTSGLQFISVVMVVASAVVLSINKVIDSQAAVAMLSAVLGYAFGRATVNEPNTPQSN